MRIACVSDMHRTVNDIGSRSLYPKRLHQMTENDALMMYEKMHREVERSYRAAIAWLQNNGPWDYLLCLGDLAGGWQERGCNHPAARKVARETVAELRSISPAYFCLGNHETGYDTFSTSPGAGMTTESVEVCREIFGELWWLLELNDMALLGICSPIEQYTGNDPTLLKYKQEQQEFIRSALASSSMPWILCTHDPFIVHSLRKILRPHLSRLRAMLFADWHDPRKGRLARIAGHILAPSLFTTTHCLKKGIMCPSTAPLWWGGYQLLMVNVDTEGMIHPTYIDIPKPEDTEQLPVSSFWRALWWMLQPAKA
ncbi:MAG: metallophosphoesterase [Candidatus Andersenbacteria bacterium]